MRKRVFCLSKRGQKREREILFRRMPGKRRAEDIYWKKEPVLEGRRDRKDMQGLRSTV